MSLIVRIWWLNDSGRSSVDISECKEHIICGKGERPSIPDERYRFYYETRDDPPRWIEGMGDYHIEAPWFDEEGMLHFYEFTGPQPQPKWTYRAVDPADVASDMNAVDHRPFPSSLERFRGASSPAPPPRGDEQAPEGEGDRPDLVTLNQCAGMAHRTKRALEHYKTKGELPAPIVEGGGGMPDLYDWPTMRTWIEAKFGIKDLPERHPANRRNA
jgi:hypothetical protein